MEKKENITIIIPKGATTDVENGLVYLTEFLTNEVFNGEWQGGGLLGGEYGYGEQGQAHAYRGRRPGDGRLPRPVLHRQGPGRPGHPQDRCIDSCYIDCKSIIIEVI